MDKVVSVVIWNSIWACLGIFFGCAMSFIIIYLCHIDDAQIANFVSVIIAAASLFFSIFSFCFKYQSSKQRRYEATFFNMLEQKYKIIENLSFCCEEWNSNASIDKYYKSTDCFWALYNEVSHIYNSLFKHGKYEKQMTENIQNEVAVDLEELRNIYNNDEYKWEKLQEYYQCRLTNFIYNIDAVMYDNAQKTAANEDRVKGCFQLCFKRYNCFLEFYFRQFYQTLLFVDKRLQDFEYYIEILKSQMTIYEKQVVYYYVISHTKLFLRLDHQEKIKELFGKSLSELSDKQIF